MEPVHPPCLAAGQTVCLIVLENQERRSKARVSASAGRRVELELPLVLRAGHAVRIESGDAAFLGEVIAMCAGGDTHIVTVELDQVLTGLAALERMLLEFADEPLRPETVYAVKHRKEQDHQ